MSHHHYHSPSQHSPSQRQTSAQDSDWPIHLSHQALFDADSGFRTAMQMSSMPFEGMSYLDQQLELDQGNQDGQLFNNSAWAYQDNSAGPQSFVRDAQLDLSQNTRQPSASPATMSHQHNNSYAAYSDPHLSQNHQHQHQHQQYMLGASNEQMQLMLDMGRHSHQQMQFNHMDQGQMLDLSAYQSYEQQHHSSQTLHNVEQQSAFPAYVTGAMSDPFLPQDSRFYPNSHFSHPSQNFIVSQPLLLNTSHAPLQSPIYDHMSPSSTLSSSGMGDSCNVTTPDSLSSYHGGAEPAAVSNPASTLHKRNESLNTYYSGNNPSSSSPIEEEQAWHHSPETLDLAFDDHPHDHAHDHTGAHFHAYSDHTASQLEPEDYASPEALSSPMSEDVEIAATPSIPMTITTQAANRRRSQIAAANHRSAQKVIAKRQQQKKDEAAKKLAEKLDKRIGKRKGPLSNDQREQAGKIRKKRACLRCKFLKKTCDLNDPCAGCRPSHARLWMVPCTRRDISQMGYFLDGWDVDFERHVTKAFSITNIVDYSHHEVSVKISHGFGIVLPVVAREVYVRDDKVFKVDWTETIGDSPQTYEQETSHLCVARQGISEKAMLDYLDKHIEGTFLRFVDEHFEGTKVLTEFMYAIHAFYQKTRNPMVANALRFFVAYNLTQHITYEEESQDKTGNIGDVGSIHSDKTVAPVMINFEVKLAMAKIWRTLHAKLLLDLNTLFTAWYSGQKQKNWALILMLSSVLLFVWEEMQFDSWFRMPEPECAMKFCNEMESTPVGVITGLFSAISQKMPQLAAWDSTQHRTVFGQNENIDELCEVVEKIQGTLRKHEKYLKARANAEYDPQDFDSLTNKFVYKIILRISA